MKRPFKQIAHDTIQFDNGNVVQFNGENDTFIDGKKVSVKEFIDYLTSDKYLRDNGYEQ